MLSQEHGRKDIKLGQWLIAADRFPWETGGHGVLWWCFCKMWPAMEVEGQKEHDEPLRSAWATCAVLGLEARSDMMQAALFWESRCMDICGSWSSGMEGLG